ncbi:MAG: iron ABC transporter permease [Methanotrichaceae archaeon]|nr:iron ABC transporter permease [Methanotrichaceae archaeon]
MKIEYGRRWQIAVHNSSFNYKGMLIGLFLLLPIPAFLISMMIGTFPLTPGEIVGLMLARLGMDLGYPSVYETVIFQVRLPRVLMAMMVGSILSVSGAAFQGIFRNPLVSPYILGLSSGAAFGAALSLGVIHWLPVQISAFLFSLIAVGAAYFMATTKGKTPVVSLVLSGVIISAVFSALLAIVQIAVDEKSLQSIVFWMMGSMNTASWSKLESSLPLALAGCLGILILRWRLNILALGDEEALSVGMNPEKYKAIFVVAAALAASSAVAVAGIIGLVGLIVPHMLRMIFGPDHRVLIPLSITFGAAFMVLVDDLARAALGFEIPVGIITTLIGAPFFAYLLRATRAGGWE